MGRGVTRGRPRARNELLVAMNGEDVGRLRRVSGGDLEFEYSPAWLERGGAVQISLSMPLASRRYRGDVVRNYFDNLLPDSREMRARMQRTLGADSTRPFDLLAAAGIDCVGALQIVDDGVTIDRLRKGARRLDSRPVSEAEIAAVLRNIAERPLGMTGEHADFRISVAGAQEKTALLMRDGHWHRPAGPTPTSHLIKLPIGPLGARIDLSESVENEWLCARIVRGFGLDAARCEIVDFEDVRALVVERFDRRWSKDRTWLIRLPQEDMCQALGVSPSVKYENEGGPGIVRILELLVGSQEPTQDRDAFFRSNVVFWLLAAIDGHAKNFSVSLRPGGGFRLTPNYDVLSVHPLLASKSLSQREVKMAMAVSGANRHYGWSKILPRHWRHTEDLAHMPRGAADTILGDCVDRANEVIERVAAELPDGFPDRVATPILEGVRRAAARLG